MSDVPALHVGPRLWLVRHGETEWSKALRHTGRTDLPLTEHGREQAASLRVPLADVAFRGVLVSPLRRARETAALALPDAEPVVVDDLRERDYGAFEGITTEAIREDVPGWTSWTHDVPDGESLADVGERCDRAIQAALAVASPAGDAGEHGADVAIVAHGHVLRSLAARWIGEEAAFGGRLALGVSRVGVLAMERDTRTLLRWNTRDGA